MRETETDILHRKGESKQLRQGRRRRRETQLWGRQPIFGAQSVKGSQHNFLVSKTPTCLAFPNRMTRNRGFLILDFFCHVLWEETSTCVVSFLFIFPHRVLPVKEERHLIKILRSNIRERRRRRRQKNIQFSVVLCGGETR